MALIRTVHDRLQAGGRRCAIILIEHHMNVVMDLCAQSRIYVLNLGEILAVGPPRAIQTDPQVVAAYLGRRRQSRD